MKNYLSFFLIGFLFIGSHLEASSAGGGADKSEAAAGAPAPGSAAEAAAKAAEAEARFAKWLEDFPRVIKAHLGQKGSMPSSMMLEVMKFLPLKDQARFMVCSRSMLATLNACRASTNPAHVLAVVDGLIARTKVVEAEQALRPFVARSPKELTPLPLLNRYILLMHSEMWSSPKHAVLRAEIFGTFVRKAGSALDVLAHHKDGNKEALNKIKATRAKLEALIFRNKKTPAIVIGEKFLSKAFPADDLAQIQQVCLKTDARQAFRAVKVSSGSGSGGGGAEAAASLQKPASAEAATAEKLADIESYVGFGTPVHALRPNQLEDHRVSTEAICFLAYFCYKDGNFGAAKDLIKDAANYDEKAFLLHWVVGILQHYHLQNFDESCHAYTRAISLEPDFAYPYYSLAVVNSDASNTQIADFLYRRCLALDPHHHYARMNRVIALNEDEAEVLDEYRRIMAIHPTEMYVYRGVARCLLRRHQRMDPAAAPGSLAAPVPVDVAEAEAVLRRSIEIDRNGAGGTHWLDLGFLLLRHRNDVAGAKECFLQFIEIAEDRELADRVLVLVQQLGVGMFPPAAHGGGSR